MNQERRRSTLTDVVRGHRAVMVGIPLALGGTHRRPLSLRPPLALGGGGRLLQRFPPNSRRRVPNSKLPLQLFNVLVPPPLPVDRYQTSSTPPAPERPWNVMFQPIPPCRREFEWGSYCRQASHRQSEVREFKRLHDNLILNAHWH